MKTTRKNGIETRTEPHTEGWVLVNSYTPHTTPWDCYLGEKVRLWRRLMKRAGIKCETPVTHERLTAPRGTGPQGRVRFGDDMMPGRADLYVGPNTVEYAQMVLANHQTDVDKWLHNGAPMPEVLRQ